MSNMVPVRDIETVTAEINVITVQTQRGLLAGAIEIGRRLVEAKSMVAPGEWGKYLQERVNYSQSSANNLMKLYREYGDNQTSLFNDFANSQTFQNLTYTKALAMLALPAELRQSFAEEHDVESMSTREVQAEVQAELEAMKEKTSKLERALNDAQDDNEVLRGNLDEMRGDMRDAQQKADEVRTQLNIVERSEKAALEKVEKLTKQLETAKQKEQKAKDALKQAKENPEIPESLMEQMRNEVAADAAKKATEDLQKQLAAAQEQAESATKAREKAEAATKEAQEKLAAAERAAKMQNPDVAVFQSLYIQLQETWNRAVGAYNKVQQADETSAANCKRALDAAIQKFQSDIAGKD